MATAVGSIRSHGFSNLATLLKGHNFEILLLVAEETPLHIDQRRQDYSKSPLLTSSERGLRNLNFCSEDKIFIDSQWVMIKGTTQKLSFFPL